MLLKGTCQCGSVRFQLTSKTPVPFNHCYCSICRKANGGGGYAINLGGEAESLQVQGKDQLKKYSAKIREGGKVRINTGNTSGIGACIGWSFMGCGYSSVALLTPDESRLGASALIVWQTHF